jgi:hypothetical protein
MHCAVADYLIAINSRSICRISFLIARSLAASTRLFSLVLGISPVTQVGLRDPRTSFLGPRTSTGTSMDPATPILLVGRALALSPFSGLSPASLPGPICPETPFNTYGDIVFY